MWIPFAIGAMLCFLFHNACNAHIAAEYGVLSIFYLASGQILSGALWYIVVIIKGCFGAEVNLNQNIIINGKINWKNVLAFIIYSLSLFLIQNVIQINLFFSDKAGINVGIMTIIWRFNCFMTALADYIING